MKLRKVIALLLVFVLLSSYFNDYKFTSYAADINDMQLASGAWNDSVVANYSAINHLITISGSGTILEENWKNLAHTIEGGSVSYTTYYSNVYGKDLGKGWQIPIDINMEFEVGSDIKFETAGFNNDYFGWFQDFKGIITLNNTIDTSAMTDMSNMFQRASNFNDDSVKDWDTSNVITMGEMFDYAKKFNQDLETNGNKWNVSSVQHMYHMFRGTESFVGKLTDWDTSSVTNMSAMFEASAFNNPINHFDVSKVEKMHYMFAYNKHFNQDISHFKLNNVTNMKNMFEKARAIKNIDLSGKTSGDLAKATGLLTNSNPDIVKFDKLRAFSWKLPNSYQIIKDDLAPIITTAGKTVSFEADHKYQLQRVDFPMELATGAVDDSVLADYNQASQLITISGDGIILEEKWKKLAHTIEGGETSYTLLDFTNDNKDNPSPYGWQIPADINMVFEPNSTIQLEEIGFKGQGYGWFQDFKGSIELNGTLDTSNLTDMGFMFQRASQFNSDISNWKTGNVTNMAYMFQGANEFNSELANWDVSKVTNMRAMFYEASNFSSDLSSWQTGNVTSMAYMFYGASKFTSKLANWNVELVLDMDHMFYAARKFNSNLQNWNVSNVTNMAYMFFGAREFESNLENWQTGNVTNMAYMFYGARKFNSKLDKWQTGSVKTMRAMFGYASQFTSNLSAWQTSQVTDMSYMFYRAFQFTSDLSGWNVANVTTMRSMFDYANTFTSDLSAWNTEKVTDVRDMFRHSISMKNIDIGNRKNAELAQVNGFLEDSNPNTVKFEKLQAFTWQLPHNYQITKDDQAPVVMLVGETANFEADHKYQLQRVDFPMELATGAVDDSVLADYNQASHLITISGNGTILKNKWIDLARKIEGGTTSYTELYDPITKSNRPYGWQIPADINMVFATGSNIKLQSDAFTETTMYGYGWFEDFKGNIEFNKTLDVSDMTHLSFMFCRAENFNDDISYWDTSNVQYMNSLFNRAKNFQGDISKWNTSSVLNMYRLFRYAEKFNSDISYKEESVDGKLVKYWDTSQVSNMGDVFLNASSFNQNISTWDTSKVKLMHYMFYGATSFNQNLNNWDTRNVLLLINTFKGATAFNNGGQPLKWQLNNISNIEHAFDGATALENIEIINTKDELPQSNNLLDGIASNTVIFEKLGAFTWMPKARYQIKKIKNGTTTAKIVEANPTTPVTFEADSRYEIRKLPVAAEVTINDFTRVYNGNLVQASELMSVLNNPFTLSGSLSFADENTNLVNAGTYNNVELIFTPDNANNYTPITISANITITKATPIVNSISETNAVYGNTLADITLPEDENGSWSFVSPLTTSVGDATETGREFGIRYTPNDLINYNSKDVNVNIKVTQKELTVTGVTAQSKEYDGNTTAKVTHTGLTGVVGSDDIGLENIVANFDNKNVGDNKVVTLAPLALTGAKKNNYSITQPSNLSASVTTKALSVSATANDKVYDGTKEATLQSAPILVGVITGDIVSLATGYYAEFDNANVGNDKTVRLNALNLEGADSNNYSLPASVDLANTANISQAGITTGNDLTTTKTAEYGQLLSTISLPEGSNYTARWKEPNKAVGDVGTHSYKVIVEPKTDFAGNFSAVEVDVDVEVGKKALKVTGVTAQSKVYDGNTTATVTASGLEGVVAGDEGKVSIGTITAKFADNAVGDNKAVTVTAVNLTGDKAENYNATLPTGLTASITKANFTPTPAFNTSTLPATYGQTLGDIKPIVADSANYTVEWKAGDDTLVGDVGNHTHILVLKPKDGNYQDVEKTITVTVSKANLVANPPSGLTAVYGQTLNDVVITTAGTGDGEWRFALGDSHVINKVGNIEYAMQFVPNNSNYNSIDTNVTISITKADLMPTPELANQSAIYGQQLKDVAIVVPENANYTASWESPDNYVGNAGAVNAHNVVLTPTDSEHYNTKVVTINVDVSQAGITTENGLTTTKTAEYGQLLSTISLPEGSNYTARWKEPNKAVGDVGTHSYKVIVEPKTAYAGNFSAVEVDVAVEVSKKLLTVAGVIAQSKVYDGNTTATVTYTGLTGVVAGDEGKVSIGSIIANFADESVGDNKVVTVTAVNLTGDKADNYNASLPTGLTAKITKAVFTPNPAFDTSTLPATYGQTLADIKPAVAESANYTVEWKAGDNTAVGNVGTNTHILVLKPKNGNYQDVEKAITVTVSKANFTPSPVFDTKALTAVYGQTLADIKPTVEENANYTVEWKTGDDTAVGNVGSNTHILMLKPKDGNYQDVEKTITVTVSKANLVANPPSGLTAVYGQTLNDVVITTAGTGDGVWSFALGNSHILDKVGNIEYAMHFTPTNSNYNSIDTNVTISITKADLVPTPALGDQSATYGQQLKDVEIVLPDGANYTASWQNPNNYVGNAGAVNTHNVVLTPTDSEHYKIKEVTVTVVVTKADITTDNLTTTTKTAEYGQLLSTISLPEGSKYTARWKEPNKAVGDVGTHSYKVIVEPKTAFAGNFSAVEVDVDVEVGKKVLTLTGVTAQNKAYDGNTTATVTASGLAGIVAGDEGKVSIGSITANFADGAVGDNKAVTVTAVNLTGDKENNYSVTLPTGLTANITKAGFTPNPAFDTSTLPAVYGQSLGDIKPAVADSANYTIEWKAGDATAVGNVGSNNHILVLKPKDGNYQDIEKTIAVTVSKATFNPNPAFDTTALTAVYGQTLVDIKPVAAESANYTLEWKAGDNTTVGNVGNHTHILVLKPKDGNYQDVEKAITVTVSKANFTPSPVFDTTALTAVYGQTLADIKPAVADSANYTIEWKAGDATAVGNVGTNNHILVIKPKDGNYQDVEKTITVTVSKATFTPNKALGNQSATYGQRLKDVEIVVPAGANYTASWQSPEDYVGNAGAVNTHNVVLTPTDSEHYNTKVVTINVDVSQAGITTGNDLTTTKTAEYGQLLSTISLPEGSNYTARWKEPNKAVGDVGTHKYKVVVEPKTDVAGNFSAVEVEVDVNVSQKALTVTGVTAQDKIYDGNTTATVTYTGLTGVVGSDDVGLEQIVANFDNKNVGDNKLVSLAPLSLTGAKKNNYAITQPNNPSASITAKVLELTGVTVQDKVFDGTTEVTVTASGLDGVVAGDEGKLSIGSITANFVDANVGDNKAVTVSAVNLTGDKAGNYNATLPTGLTASITKANFTPTPAFDTSTLPAVYGQTLGDIKPTVADSANYTLEWKAGDDTAVGNVGGNNHILVLKPKDGNYQDVEKTITVTVSKANLVASPPSGLSAVYGQTLNDVVITTAGTGNGVWSFALGNSHILDKVGNIEYAMHFTPTNSNYNGIDTNVTISITKADLMPTPALGNQSATYGQQLKDVEIVLPDGANYTASWQNPNNYVGNAGAVNTHNVVLTPTDSEHYKIKEVTVTVVVTKADITTDNLTTTTKTAEYGQLLSTISLPEGSNYTARWKEPNKAVGDVGTHTHQVIVEPKAAYAGNFSAVEVDVAVEVSKKALTIAGVTAQNKVYDGNTTATVTASGLAGIVAGDESKVSIGSITANFADEVVGDNKVVTVTAVNLAGDKAENYSVTLPAGLTASITKASFTPNPAFDTSELPAVYGQTLGDIKPAVADSANYTIEWKAGDNTAVGNVGNNNHILVIKPKNGNYQDVEKAITVTVSKANFTPSPVFDTKALTAVYGQTLADIKPTVEENANYTVEWKTGDDTAVGNVGSNTHILMLKPKDGNYQDVEKAITVTVSKANLVANPPSGLTAVYGQTLNDVVITTAGTGDGKWRFALGDSHVINKVGNIEYAMQFVPNNSNYNSIDTNVTISITKADLVPTPELANQSAIYGQQLKDVAIVVPENANYTASWESPEDNVGNAGAVNTHNVVLTPTDSEHYNTKVVTINVEVSQAGITTGNDLTTTKTAEYGQLLSAISLPEGSNYTARWKEPNKAVGDVGTHSYKVIVEPKTAFAGNFSAVEVDVDVEVGKKDLTVTGVTAQNKAYDGNTTATVTASGLAGIVAGDEGKVSIGSITANFADGAVGDNKVVTVTAVNLAGDKAGNYNVTLPAGLTASITKANFTPNPVFDTSALNAVYGQTLADIKPTVAESANYTVEWKTGDNTAVGNVGGNNHILVLKPKDSNYQDVEKTIAVTVSKAEFTPNLALGNQSATYGQQLKDVTIVLPAGANYTANWESPEDNVGNAGAVNTHNVVLTPTDSEHYNTKVVTVTVNVDKAEPVASPPNGLTAVYGQTLADVDISSATGDGVWRFNQGDDTSVGEATKVGEAGNLFSMKFTPNDEVNYNAKDVNVNIKVTQKALTVTGVTAQSKEYDGSTTATVTHTGLTGVVGSDDVSLENIVANFDNKNVGDNKVVTLAPLALTGAKKNNYSITQPSNPSASITAKALSVSATANDKVYDGTKEATLQSAPTLEGVITGDIVSLAIGYYAEFDNADVGEDKTVSLNSLALEGADKNNYSLPVSVVLASTANITKANPIATPPSGLSAVYGQTLKDVVVTTAGTGDGIWRFTLPETTSVGVSTTTGAPFALEFTPTDSVHYKKLYQNVPVIVSQKQLRLTDAKAVGKVYDGNAIAEVRASKLAGIIAGDEDKVSVGTITANFDDNKVGTNKAVIVSDVKLIGERAGNYKATLPTGLTATIAKANFTPSPAFTQELTASYGQQLSEISLTAPAGANYTVAWKEPDYVISETGKQQYLVVLTPIDYGKVPVEMSVTVMVNKAEFIVDTDHLTATGVYGQSLAEIKLETDDYQIIWNKADTILRKGGEIEYHQATLVPKNDNYQNIKDVTVAITVEKAPAPTLTDVELEFKAPIDRLVTTTLSAIEVGLPSDSGVVDYKLKVVNDSDGIISEEELRGSYLSYQLVAESADKNGEIELEAEMENYESASFRLLIKTVNKDVPELTLGSIVKDYDKKPITADELNKSSSFDGKELTGEWQFSQNLEDIIKAGKHIIEVIFTADDSDNYAVVKGSVSIEIEKVPLKIVGVKAIDRYYQKNRLDVELTGGELQGVLAGDEVGFELNNNSDKSGRINDDSVGQDKRVITDITLTGKDSDNYYLIQPEDILVTISSLPVYDDEDDEEESEAESTADIASPAPDIEAESEAEPESATVEVSAADKVVETETKPTISEVLTSTEVMTQTEATTLAKGELINKIVEPSSEVKKAVKPLVVEGKVFEDTESEQWYAPAVKYVVEKGLMQGTSEHAFSPEIDTTRAEIVTVIYRLENISGSKLNEEMDLMFSDVTEDEWYTKAVKWGAKEDIVAGFTDLTFRPQVNITREQLVALLYRYAEHKGYNVNKRAELSKYNDSEKIGDYAKESMSWAVAEGLISGRDEKTLAPINGATRAEISSVFKRFSEKYDKWLIAR